MEERKNLSKKKRPRRDHVTHHVTHVIDDGGANDGTRKSHVHVHEKTIKSPVLPYNKWEAQPSKGTARSESPIPVSHAAGGPAQAYVIANGADQTRTVCSTNGVFEAEVRTSSSGHHLGSWCLGGRVVRTSDSRLDDRGFASRS